MKAHTGDPHGRHMDNPGPLMFFIMDSYILIGWFVVSFILLAPLFYFRRALCVVIGSAIMIGILLLILQVPVIFTIYCLNLLVSVLAYYSIKAIVDEYTAYRIRRRIGVRPSSDVLKQ